MQMLTAEYGAQRINAQYENCATNEKLSFYFSFDNQKEALVYHQYISKVSNY